MRNKNLKALIAQKANNLKSTAEIIILNDDEISMAMGGTVSCPNLTSCGSFSNCNDKCGVKVGV